jgi:hypothetical protein
MISIGTRRSKLTQAMERIMCLSPYLRELITREYIGNGPSQRQTLKFSMGNRPLLKNVNGR